MFSSVSVCSGPQFGAPVVGSYAPGDAALINAIHFHLGSRLLRWRIDLLTFSQARTTADGSPAYKADLTPYVSKFTVTNDSNRAVARSMDLTMVETAASQTLTVGGTTIPVPGSTGTGFFGPGLIIDAGLNYLSDLVRPVALIGVPGTSNWIHCPIGVFRFTTPKITVPGYAVLREATLPDLTSIVQDNAALDPTNVQGVTMTLPAGFNVIDIVSSLLSNSKTLVQDITSNATMYSSLPGCDLGQWLPSNVTGAPASNTPGDWPASTAKLATNYPVSEGTSYLDLINHLLRTINCYPLQADERGILRVQKLPTTVFSAYPAVPVTDYTTVSPVWTYDTTSDSIVTYGLGEELDIGNIANIVQVKIEDGDRTPYLATAINQDPGSPYNINNWAGTGQTRKIIKVIDDGQIPDFDPTANINYPQQYAARELLQASWLTDQVDMPIAVNPMHAGGNQHDVIALNIYQQYVAAGSPRNLPVIIMDPGLQIGQLFVVDGWTITANLATPGSGSNLTGNTGLTTDLSPRESKQGSTMVVRAHRVTKTLSPSGITFLP